jgi:hypothetical protein
LRRTLRSIMPSIVPAGPAQPVLVDFPVGGSVYGRGQHVVPERTRAQRPDRRRTRSGEIVDLPIEARIGPIQAQVAQRHRQRWAPLFVECQMRGELIEVSLQLGMKLLRHMLAKQAAQSPAGHDDRGSHPEYGASEQPDAQRAAQRETIHRGAVSR